MNTKERLRDLCETISNDISNPKTITEDDLDEYPDATIGDTITAYEYLESMLDIKYIVDSKKEYIGAEVCVALGGPNIYINTRNRAVEGYWGSSKEVVSYIDDMGIDSYCEELFNCS